MSDSASDAGRVCIVLVMWERVADTIECLESILRSTYGDYRVLICDNGSSESSLDQLRRWADGRQQWTVPVTPPWSDVFPARTPRRAATYRELDLPAGAAIETAMCDSDALITVLRLGGNRGFGAGNNAGMRFVRACGWARWLWLLNNDTVIAPDTLGNMARAAAHRRIVGSTLVNYAAPHVVQSHGGGRFSALTGMVVTERKSPQAQLDFINGASMLLPVEALDSVGYFDERIFMYFEENDYCIRAMRSGFTMTNSGAQVYHKGGASGGGQGSAFAWNAVYTSKTYVMRKHFGWGAWTVISLISWLVFPLLPGTSKAKRSASMAAVRNVFELLMTPVRNG